MLALAVFVGLPILEIVLLVQAGIVFGIWWLLAWIFISAGIGVVLIRGQGLAALRQAQLAQDAGEVPVGAILTGIRLAFAGLFMILPGFITDALGLLLLLPWTGDSLGRIVSARVRMHSTWVGGRGTGGPHDPNRSPSAETIDAEYEVVPRDDDGQNQDGQNKNLSDEPRDPPAKPPAKRDGNPWEGR
tara:strand:- start:85 stop:648 length:564 start_codon:yes stop_codon:yes gene_type:complete